MPFDPVLPRVLVTFDALPGDLRERLAGAGATHAVVLPDLDAAAVVGPPRAYESIAAWPEVSAVTPDVSLRLHMWQANETTRVDDVHTGVRPLRRSYSGKGVTVAVVDSGVDTAHPDLAGQVLLNLDFSPSAIFDPLATSPTDLDSHEPVIADPVELPVGTDPDNHGTFMAGVVAGTGAAALGTDDLGGVAPQAKIVNLDVGTGQFFVSSVLAAFQWIIDHRADPRLPGGIGVAVGGFGGCTLECDDGLPLLRQLLNKAMQAGVAVVFPAADAGDGDIVVPGRYPEVIAAKGGCKNQDDWSHRDSLEWAGAPPTGDGAPLCGKDRTFQSFGSASIDVVAPAVDVWVPRATGISITGLYPLYRPPAPGEGDPGAENNNRIWYQWTISHSLAAAQVAGVAALMLEANPDLTHAEIEEILKKTARDLGPKGFDPSSGAGMLDAFKAVKRAE